MTRAKAEHPARRNLNTSLRFVREPNDRAPVFGKTRDGVDHGRTPEDHPPTQDSGPKKQPHHDREEILAQAMVATGDTGKRRARSETRRLQADECEENRGVAQALGRTYFAPQGRRLSLGAVDADFPY